MNEDQRVMTVELHLPDGRVVPVTGTYHDHDELAEAADQGESIDAVKIWKDVEAAVWCNNQAMLNAGHSETELAGLNIADLMNGKWVAQQLQGEAGNGPVGGKLVKQIKSCTPKGQSVRVTAMLTNMTVSQINQIRRGERDANISEAAQLAVAYGVTTGELLGIVDADEVRLLKAWRGLDEDKRAHLLAFLE